MAVTIPHQVAAARSPTDNHFTDLVWRTEFFYQLDQQWEIFLMKTLKEILMR